MPAEKEALGWQGVVAEAEPETAEDDQKSRGGKGREDFPSCPRYHVSPGHPGNVESASFIDSFGRNAGVFERSEPAPKAESVPASLDSREIGRAEGCGPPAQRRTSP